MRDAVDNLYTTFAHYRIGDNFADGSFRPKLSAKLAISPIRELTYDDLEQYSRLAVSKWGNAGHFKHFLPRLLELSVEYRDAFLDLPAVFGKLQDTQFDSWPQREQDAVNGFFDKYWEHQLSVPIVGAFEDSTDTVLCALSNALSSVQRFLDVWIADRSGNGKRHLAAFIMHNDATLIKKGRLSNPFWDANRQPHNEVINWLRSDAVNEYFGEADEFEVGNDFACAWPQLTAIRSALAARRK